MTWTRHHVEVAETCAHNHPHTSHLTECIRVFIKDSYSKTFQSGSSGQMFGCMVSWGLGCIVFPLCLGVFQIGVFKPLSVTSSHLLAPAIGLGSVALSGIASSITVFTAYSNYNVSESRELDVRFTDLVCYGLGSAAIFKLLRGKFSSVLPSTILKPGAFARRGIPATKNYASSGKKATLAAIGSRHGCHTCGKRWTAKSFIADHQPPLSLPKRTDIIHTLSKLFRPHEPEYRFYPHCPSCSRVQMTYLGAMANQRTTDLTKGRIVRMDFNHIVTHATSLRLYHLYLPLPAVLAAAYNACAG
ncbi:uncharacterized protein LOC121430967 [Lytechinus variegatus]|uniref:uncharacterized protein LOC121430967 n=1 Tax=Lytechinus variegatus TaxID=7654 RepID=UPI001BB224D3|nr:uncharacterized protein LOC121430967 [Lytechinus variegatus]